MAHTTIAPSFQAQMDSLVSGEQALQHGPDMDPADTPDDSGLLDLATRAARKYGWDYLIRADQFKGAEEAAIVAAGYAVLVAPNLYKLTNAGVRAALGADAVDDFDDNDGQA